ncbi:MAG: DUF3572 family protein [Hyphomicrobiales bacterium]|nr:DUF3572 family protein [Hyphomicrobiales bacterium]
MQADRNSSRSRAAAQNLASLAGAALAYLASDEEMLWRFLDLTGMQPNQLRDAAKAPAFLHAIIEHILSDDRLIEGLAGSLSLDPAKLAQQCHALLPSGGAAEHGEPDPWVDP